MPPPTTRQSVSIVCGGSTGAACSALLWRTRRGAWSAVVKARTHAATRCRRAGMAMAVAAQLCLQLLRHVTACVAVDGALRMQYTHTTDPKDVRTDAAAVLHAIDQVSIHCELIYPHATSPCKLKGLERPERSLGTATGRFRLDNGARRRLPPQSSLAKQRCERDRSDQAGTRIQPIFTCAPTAQV